MMKLLSQAAAFLLLFPFAQTAFPQPGEQTQTGSASGTPTASATVASSGDLKVFRSAGHERCEKTLILDLHATNPDALADNNAPALGELITSAGTAIDKECAGTVTRIIIVGYVDDKPVKAFAAAKKKNWAYKKAGIPPEVRRALAQEQKSERQAERQAVVEKRNAERLAAQQAREDASRKAAEEQAKVFSELTPNGKQNENGLSGPWRFRMSCGQDTYLGFFTLKLSGGEAEAIFESISRYPQIGVLKTSGTYDPGSRALALKSTGFLPDLPEWKPFDFVASVNSDNNHIRGSAQGAQVCDVFEAWKTSFDVRRNPAGLVEAGLQGGGKRAQFPGVKKITIEQCERFIDWYSTSTSLSTPDGKTASVVVDSDKMLDVLGFTYDGMSPDDKFGFVAVTRHCTTLLKQSPDTKHVQLMSQYDKAYNGMSTDASPYLIGHQGGKIKEISMQKQLNYYWYQHMYIATSIRDTRKAISQQYAGVKALPVREESLPAVAGALIDIQGKPGQIAALSEADKKEYVDQLTSIQTDIVNSVVDAKLRQINWNEFDPSIEGLVKLREKQKETAASLDASMPQTGKDKLNQAFDERYRQLSNVVTDKAISAFPGINASLDGLRNYRSIRVTYYEKYQPVLTDSDLTRLLNYIDKGFTESVNNSSGSFAGWLKQDVPSDQSGLVILNDISNDILGVALKDLGKDSYPRDLTSMADAIRAREIEIKTEECIVPKGFEEMKATICPDQSS